MLMSAHKLVVKLAAYRRQTLAGNLVHRRKEASTWLSARRISNNHAFLVSKAV